MSADISPDLRRRIAKAAAKHAAAKAQRQVIAGELAAALGVDRARTLRRLLGK